MEWIKVEKATCRKPEVLRIASALNIHPDHAFGLCVRFWCWCDDQVADGHAPGVTSVTLDMVLGHAGFATELKKSGWLHETDSGIEIPHFDYHLSESSKTRAQSAKRKQKQRLLGHMSRSARDKSVTTAGPEKRREEKNIETHTECVPRKPEKQTRERKAFVRPTIGDVMQYLTELQSPIDAKEFVDYYESNGWKVGNNAMKDWRATVRRWEAKRKTHLHANGHTNGTSNGSSPEWLEVLSVVRKYPTNDRTDQEARKSALPSDLFRAMAAVKSSRLAECSNDFERKALREEFEFALAKIRKEANGSP